MSRFNILCLAGALLACRSPAVLAADPPAWSPKQAPLMTRWAAEVDPANPLPEYPRPQLVRSDWLSLNGIWEYQQGAAGDAAPIGTRLAGSILVPFPVESALSGVMEHHDRLWYRRAFTVPAAWAGKRTLLHFGAVDYETEILINGQRAGTHIGGYEAFTVDATPFLRGAGEQELIVRVFDPTQAGGQPRGKQTTTPGGIMYTPTSGIWKPVWLEPVPPASIGSLKIVPDIDARTVKVTVMTEGAAVGQRVKVVVSASGKQVAIGEGVAGQELSIAIAEPNLWSPDHPFLYDLDVALAGDAPAADRVTSYFGMRKISVGEINGVKRLLLNNQPVFQMGPLDQGFWPDGIYTAPTDAALRYDIEQTKAMGFNLVRKHIKVEPDRWYYWTDKLGLLVWQDMPSADSYMDPPKPTVDAAQYEAQLTALVRNHWNSPSIVTWVVFNEGQGQHDTSRLVDLVRALDPTRLINEASGGEYTGSGDIRDEHRYPEPGCPTSATQALACGEYGGIGFTVPGHTWNGKGGGYTNVPSAEDLVFLYADYAQMVKDFRDAKGLSAVVYTQITDVETELNGLLTYDRLPKCPIEQLRKINRFEFAPPTYREIVPTSEAVAQEWTYSTEHPKGPWNRLAFDETGWRTGPGGFGERNGLGRTPWKTQDIWLRKRFTLGALTPAQIHNIVLRDFHDDDIEVFINGVLAYQTGGYISRYEVRGAYEAARNALVPNAENLIAVHCHQRGGGQYIDVGLAERVPAAP